MQRIISMLLLSGLPVWSMAQQHHHHENHQHGLEELVVSGAQEKSRADSMLPMNVLSGELLKENATKSLGETLSNQLGVTSASFGPGVGQPIIRGQSGNRVRVLRDGVGVLDVSSSSQDHANAVEPLLAERIEVIRGPATLLYGNGAIGGIVNVIDNRIPEQVPEEFIGAIELRHNSAAEENAAVFKLDGGSGSFAWHLDGLTRDSENLEIPGLAVDVEAVEALEGHEEEAHAEEEEIENTDGFIANTDSETTSVTGGLSWVGENGFFGLSVSVLENEYGIPPGAHGHGHHEEEAGAGHAEEGEENIRLDVEQTQIDLKGGAELGGLFNQLKVRLTVNDYEHTELEGIEAGTVFANEGYEGRATLSHGEGDWTGVIGMQISDSEFSAVGEEAFIPKADIQATGLFLVETIDRSDWVYEFGLRVDSQDVEPQAGVCDSSENTWSGSVAAIWRTSEESNVLFALNRSERSASVEELFSNIGLDSCLPPVDQEQLVQHASTARFEIGNPNLETEVSQNFEIGFRKHAGNVRAEVNLFHNEISDYIYLADVGEFEETIVSHYLQQDATFSGVEAEVLFPFEISAMSHFDLRLFMDWVEAELDDGSNLPRIPAMSYGLDLAFAHEDWLVKLRATTADDQDDVGLNEAATEGYTRVDLYADYHFDMADSEFLIFAKANNITDEEIRNHSSFLKNFAPEAGRGYELGLRYSF